MKRIAIPVFNVSFSILFSISFFSFVHAESSSELVRKSNLARLESYRSECLVKFSGNQRFCRKRVLKQCRDMLEKKDCLLLMNEMPESKFPKTSGRGQLE